jgi:BlaI family penicillinase repressor
MSVIWQQPSVDAKFVIEQLAEANQWSDATVKTMLHRLVKKGVLATVAEGKRYLYRANMRRGDCVRQARRSFLARVFGGEAAPALLHLVKSAKLTAAEVAQLRALLDEKESKE